jgi:preprotein translocase subunit SecY
VSIFGGSITPDARQGGLTIGLFETFRQAWADPDLKKRILFIVAMFGVFVLGVNIPCPISGINQSIMDNIVKNNPFFQLANVLGGGALRRLSIFALGLNPYITASIIMQILTTALPAWKKEQEEGGEYARQTNNKRTRFLSLFLCILQGMGFYQQMSQAIPTGTWVTEATTILFWTAGAMFMVWLGEQISEKGIGNGVSLMIFAGIVLSIPYQFSSIQDQVHVGAISLWAAIALGLIFLGTTWVIVLFTTAQRRIPMQHMRRQMGTRAMGGNTSYLPIPVNTAGVIPIIFAVSLLFIPIQFATFFEHSNKAIYNALLTIGTWMNPGGPWPYGFVGAIVYAILIFFFTYFYTAIQYNVEDIANNLKKSGSFIPGVRPGKQTKDFLDGILSRVTVAGAGFLTVIALVQYVGPAALGLPRTNLNIIGGTSLLIMVQVAIETMRQVEANLIMRQYGT